MIINYRTCPLGCW